MIPGRPQSIPQGGRSFSFFDVVCFLGRFRTRAHTLEKKACSEPRPGSWPDKGAAPRRRAVATDGPGLDPDLDPGPGSKHHYFF